MTYSMHSFIRKRLLPERIRTFSTNFLPTIYALSTPPGQRAAIAVLRISGTHAKYIFRQLTKSEHDPLPMQATLKRLYAPSSEQKIKRHLLDHSLTLFFQSPRTFTGEDILELHLHGGKAVTNSVLRAIQSLHDREKGINIRYANAGEFSQRAFQNGKFDLTEIEGIRELIDAETESQRRSALSSFNGANKATFTRWRTQIINSIAQLTAIIDFGEDSELDNTVGILTLAEGDILKLKSEIEKFITKIEKSSILQSGIKLVLLGQPNAGKSSLVNSICNEDVSIVSKIPGTTRDAIETVIDINGFKVKVCDTAGIRDRSTDAIEILGIDKAIKKGIHCDVCLLVVDPLQRPLISDEIKQVFASPEFVAKDIIIAINKTDVVSEKATLKMIKSQLSFEFARKIPTIAISCLTSSGIHDLIHELTKKFQAISDSNDDSDPIIISQRVKDILVNDVLYGINQSVANKQLKQDVVMASESLSYAAEGIGKITGETVGIEEVLGVVFANFCVGK